MEDTMKAKSLTLPVTAGLALVSPVATAAQNVPAPSAATYVATVDPSAFREKPLEHRKLGVTVSPAAVRLIAPGIDKFSIYNLIGPPHFGEAITRRWNYVLFFPADSGSTERQRCRMEIRFGPKRPDGYNVTVAEVVWREQSCADRVAAAS
jgi:hypothetical protein